MISKTTQQTTSTQLGTQATNQPLPWWSNWQPLISRLAWLSLLGSSGAQAQGMPGNIDLGTLPSNQGLVLDGAAPNDFSGLSASGAGDVNGDGIDDLLIGSPRATALGRSRAGTAHLVYGSRNLPGTLDLSSLNASIALVLDGAIPTDNTGCSVSSAGDINGDGLADMIIGADNLLGRSRPGTAYVVYGNKNLPSSLDLSSLNASQGVVLKGAEQADFAGRAVSSAGDVNGDGLNDILIGAENTYPLGRSGAGAAYLVYGSKNLPGVLNLGSLNATQGMMIYGARPGDILGNSVSGAGDVNGDGLADIIVGASQATAMGRSNAGLAYLIYGSKNLPGVLDMRLFNSSLGMVLQGAAANHKLGTSVSSAGDVNGDGVDDMVIGASDATAMGRRYAGSTYLIYGSKSLPGALDLSLFNSALGMVLHGAAPLDFSGFSVSSAGDINRDGLADLIVGAGSADPLNRTDAGTTYAVYGSTDLPGVMDLGSLNASEGLILHGVGNNDYTGACVSSAGDVNGDGVADMVIGAFNASPLNRTSAGATYVVYGKAAMTTTPSTQPPSTTVAQPSSTSTGLTQNMTSSSTIISDTTPQNTSLAQTTPGGTSTTDSSTFQSQQVTQTTTAPKEEKEDDNSATIIGATVGSVALAAALGVVGFYAYKKWRGHQDTTPKASVESGTSMQGGIHPSHSGA